MNSKLHGIPGIGPSSALDLAAIGITTATQLAKASIAEVSAARGFGEKRAEKVIASALETLREGTEAIAKELSTAPKSAKASKKNEGKKKKEKKKGRKKKTKKEKAGRGKTKKKKSDKKSKKVKKK